MTAENIIAAIKKGDIRPVYFLYGEEPYFIDTITDYIENHLLDESHKGFDQMVLYGRDTNIEEIIAAARRFPMMSERQVIIIKEAQDLARNMDKMEAYLENPQTSTVLVFNYKYKKPDKRKKVFKMFEKTGVFFESKSLYENQVPGWIQKHVEQSGYHIDTKSCMLLVEHLGNDLSRIANELKKLALVLPEKGTITPELIEKHIGVSKDYNNFELQDAVAKKDFTKSYKIIQYFAADPRSHPFVVTLASLQSFFTHLLLYHGLANKSDKYAAARSIGVNPYFLDRYRLAAGKYPMRQVSRIIGILHEYDLKSKGVGAANPDTGELLKEMIYKILH